MRPMAELGLRHRHPYRSGEGPCRPCPDRAGAALRSVGQGRARLLQGPGPDPHRHLRERSRPAQHRTTRHGPARGEVSPPPSPREARRGDREGGCPAREPRPHLLARGRRHRGGARADSARDGCSHPERARCGDGRARGGAAGGGCRFPGCTATHRLHGHHVKHWADGGETSLGNLILLCPTHHRLVHEGGFDVQRLDDGMFRFTNPHGLAIRPPPAAARGVFARHHHRPERIPRTRHRLRDCDRALARRAHRLRPCVDGDDGVVGFGRHPTGGGTGGRRLESVVGQGGRVCGRACGQPGSCRVPAGCWWWTSEGTNGSHGAEVAAWSGGRSIAEEMSIQSVHCENQCHAREGPSILENRWWKQVRAALPPRGAPE